MGGGQDGSSRTRADAGGLGARQQSEGGATSTSQPRSGAEGEHGARPDGHGLGGCDTDDQRAGRGAHAGDGSSTGAGVGPPAPAAGRHAPSRRGTGSDAPAQHEVEARVVPTDSHDGMGLPSTTATDGGGSRTEGTDTASCPPTAHRAAGLGAQQAVGGRVGGGHSAYGMARLWSTPVADGGDTGTGLSCRPTSSERGNQLVTRTTPTAS